MTEQPSARTLTIALPSGQHPDQAWQADLVRRAAVAAAAVGWSARTVDADGSVVVLTAGTGSPRVVNDASQAAALDVDALLADAAEPTVVRDGGLALRHGWRADEVSGHDPIGVVALGSNTMTGNGYLGYRGTLPEWGADGYVACVVSDTYDTADGKWTELVSVPNALSARWLQHGASLDLPPDEAREDAERGLLIRYGLTKLGVRTPAGWLRTERFASMTDLHAVHQRQVLLPTVDGEVVLEAAIDGRVWSLNGDHFKTYSDEHRPDDDLLVTSITTPERGTTVVVAQGLSVDGAEVISAEVVAGERVRTRRLRLQVAAGQMVVVHTVMAVASSNDGDDPAWIATTAAAGGRAMGWSRALAAHAAAWDRVWDASDIAIDGDELSQVALRFGTYHNVIATPRHSDRLPLGARGLSCQAYQGAAFWDQEAFNMPMFAHTQPEVARNLLTFRHATLPGAKAKAERLGYDGAFYAWVSGDTGQELCPDFFFKDILTGRWVRNHFNDWQIHVSPDLSTAIADYVAVTGDIEFMREGGAELVVEVARFCASFVHYRPADEQYHCIRLLGPDEYHENVDDNAFTNHQLQRALQIALDLAPDLLDTNQVTAEERALWADIVERIHLPAPDPLTGVIEQFRGYHDLEDTTPEVVAGRLKDPGEYWGWPNGVAVHTQVIKQADVIQLFVMQPGRFDSEVMAANYDHYLPRTQHGSSLSPSAYAIIAAWLGRSDEARRLFLDGATVDLLSLKSKTSGGTFIGGIRTAAAGVSWLVIARGFMGLRAIDVPSTNARALGLAPVLPDGWTRVSLPLVWRGQRLRVEVDPQRLTATADPANDASLLLSISGEVTALEPGESLRASR